MKLLFIFNAVIFILFILIITIMFVYLRIVKNQHKKEKEEIMKHEENVAEIITEANKQKEAARSNNASDDINYMAKRLHEFANR